MCQGLKSTQTIHTHSLFSLTMATKFPCSVSFYSRLGPTKIETRPWNGNGMTLCCAITCVVYTDLYMKVFLLCVTVFLSLSRSLTLSLSHIHTHTHTHTHISC